MKQKITPHTPGILRMLVLFAALGGLWWFFRNYMLFLMLLILAVGCGLSILAFRCGAAGLRWEAALSPARVGKDGAMKLSLSAGLPFSIPGFPGVAELCVRNCFTGKEIKKKERFFLGEEGAGALTLTIRDGHYGRTEVRFLRIRGFDYLRLVQLTLEPDWEKEGYFFPMEEAGEEEEPEELVEDFREEQTAQKHHAQPEPDFEIREYIPGDELKTIHWKLTAKHGKTMVRERQYSGKYVVNLLVELTEDAAENDDIMDSLWRVGQVLLAKGYPIRVHFPGKGGGLESAYLLEKGELARVVEDVLSICVGIPEHTQSAFAEEYPGEDYVIVRGKAKKTKYIKANRF